MFTSKLLKLVNTFKKNCEKKYLYLLIIVSTSRNRESLSLPKENENRSENEENHNEVFDNFKKNLLEEFNDSKRSFFHEVKPLKEDILKLQKATPENPANQQQIITLLHNDIRFLREQLQQKDKFIDYLMKQLLLQNEYVLQQKYSNIQKETERKPPPQNETENKTENNCGKSKIPSKTSSKESINNSTKTRIISRAENYVEEETEENNPAENKTTDEQRIAGIHEKEKTIGSRKDSTQDTASAARNRHNNQGKSSKSVVILGDSMIKHLNGWEMSKRINSKCKIFVKTFSGATTTCMEDYIKPSLRMSPDHFILHTGTNDLASSKTSQEIANSIINLACQLKTDSHDVSVSTIIVRGDDKKLNEKGCEVNAQLKELCKGKNIYLIDNSKRIKPQHLNKGKLHLKKNGSKMLSNNFVGQVSKVFN